MFRSIVSMAALVVCANAQAQDSFFPIWGDEAEARGYTLPKPYGLSLSYMDMSNPVSVNSIPICRLSWCVAGNRTINTLFR